MTSIYCPHCRNKKPNVSRSIEKCIHCEKSIPDCPKYESRNVGFIGIYLLGCYSFRKQFEPPTDLRNKGQESGEIEWKHHWENVDEAKAIQSLGSEQRGFLLRVAERLAQ